MNEIINKKIDKSITPPGVKFAGQHPQKVGKASDEEVKSQTWEVKR